MKSAIVILLTMIFFLTGCFNTLNYQRKLGKTNLINGQKVDSEKNGQDNNKKTEISAREGLTYYLGQSLIKLDGEIITRRYNKVIEGESGLQLNEFKEKSTDVNISQLLVADQRYPFKIDIKPKIMMEKNVTFDLSEDGRLKGLNKSTVGKAGEVVKSVGKVITTVASMAALVASAHRESTEKDSETCKKISIDEGLSINHQYFVENDQSGCALLKNKLEHDKILKQKIYDLNIERKRLKAIADIESLEKKRLCIKKIY